MPDINYVLLYVDNPLASATFYADLLGKPRLGLHMDVFEREVFGDAALLVIGGDRVETLGDRLGVPGRKDALRPQHRDMRLRAGDILPPQLLVERDRGVYLAHHRGRAFGEAPAPHCIGAVRARADRLSPWPYCDDRRLR